MAKIANYQLTDDELEAIEKAIRQDKRPEVRQRGIAIRLLHLGHKPEEVAEMQAVSQPTIYGWWKRFQKGGGDELANKPRSGRPMKADEGYIALLEQVVEQEDGPVNQVENPFDKGAAHDRRKRVGERAAEHLLCQRARTLRRQRVQVQRGTRHIGIQREGELAAVVAVTPAEEHSKWHITDIARERNQQFLGIRIQPMDIFQDEKHWLTKTLNL